MTSAKKDKELVLEITSDFVCPWCYIGDTRLEEALKKAAPNLKIKRKWRPYELNRNMPETGMDRKEYLSKKFGGPEKLREIDEGLKTLGAEDGLDFRPDLIKKSPNTLKAHRLMLLAAKEGKADELAMLIFKAYFNEGKNIGDPDVLTALAGKVGLDEKKVKAFLATDEGTDDVRRMEEEGMDRGIEGVPFTVIEGEELHGALPVEDIVDTLNNVLKTRQAA